MDTIYKCSGVCNFGLPWHRYVTSKSKPSPMYLAARFNWKVTSINVEEMTVISQAEFEGIHSDLKVMKDQIIGPVLKRQTNLGTIQIETTPSDVESKVIKVRALENLLNKVIVFSD